MSVYLLDTDVVLRSLFDSSGLAPGVQQVLGDPASERRVSVVSAFEIAVKHTLGKLPLPAAFDVDFDAAFEDLIVQLAASPLEVRLADALRVRRLPLHHRDPFDRLLIAQALEGDMTIVSGDRHFPAYGGLKVMSA